MKTDDAAYSLLLQDRSAAWWKRILPVQYPYSRFARQTFPKGKVLDVGCGYGRILRALPPGSVGVDHNPDLIAVGLAAGFDVCLPDQFVERFGGGVPLFDGLVCAHVLEHMERPAALKMLRQYIAAVRPGRVCMLVTPQARGFAADPTHVLDYTLSELAELAEELDLVVRQRLSYPFPQVFGKFFTYNENIVLAATKLSR